MSRKNNLLKFDKSIDIMIHIVYNNIQIEEKGRFGNVSVTGFENQETKRYLVVKSMILLFTDCVVENYFAKRGFSIRRKDAVASIVYQL